MKRNIRLKTLSNNLYMLKLIWRISPKRVILSFVNSLMGFTTWVFYTVVFMRYLFGAAELKRGFTEVAAFVVGVTVFLFLLSAFSSWYHKSFMPVTDQELNYRLNMQLFEKATSVDISCYENPGFYDSYTKATTEVYTRAISVLDNMSTAISALFASIYVIYTIYSINKIAALFTALPLTGKFLLGKIVNKIRYEKSQMDIPYKRRQDYVNRAIYLQKFSKEIRMSNIFNVLEGIYNEAYKGLFTNIDRFSKKIFSINLTNNILCCPLVFEGLWLYAAYMAMVPKTLEIGGFVILANAIVSTTWMIDSLTRSIVASYENGLYIDNLKEFLNYKEKIKETQTGLVLDGKVETIEFRNVSFRYDGQDKDVLKNINLIFPAGKKVALVGHNGAGKTTLIKLMMRLYDPSEGEILLNGVNIKEYDLKEYRRLIGTTFQDFQMFSMTAIENVLMDDVKDEAHRKKGIEAMKKSDAYNKVKSLEKAEDTVLTREFDDMGAVLSGGQFQKIAVARAFARNASIILLDEPSSALDPISEYQMYETIMRLGEDDNGNKNGKITVIISHRLSSAAMADYIYVLEDGALIEEGMHKSLMKKGGAYAVMFKKQAESYLQEVAV